MAEAVYVHHCCGTTATIVAVQQQLFPTARDQRKFGVFFCTELADTVAFRAITASTIIGR